MSYCAHGSGDRGCVACAIEEQTKALIGAMRTMKIDTMCSHKDDETCDDPEQCKRAGCVNKPGYAPTPIDRALETLRATGHVAINGPAKPPRTPSQSPTAHVQRYRIRGDKIEPLPPEIPAARILRKAADLVEQRAASRDKPDGEKSMASTVKAFNAIYGTNLTEVQGWHFMELLKMVRSAYGVYVPDDFDDKVAYAALAAEAAEGEKK